MRLHLGKYFSAPAWWLMLGLLALMPIGASLIHAQMATQVSIKTAPLEAALNRYFGSHKMVSGVYFEYIPSHQSLSINADEPFLSLSLLKVPFVMDLYKAAELKRLDMSTQVAITQDMRNTEFGDLGASSQSEISLQSAAQITLVKSDNTALNVVKYYSQNFLGNDEKAMSKINIEPVVRDGMDNISARQYSGFLHCLYVACYNNSQEMLEYLSETSFPGISDGIPSSVRVAHKIGTSTETHDDCGIVYAPHRPYILCVMLNQPHDTYAKTMKDVSKIVYDEVMAAGTSR